LYGRPVPGDDNSAGLVPKPVTRLDAVGEIPIPSRSGPDGGGHGMKHQAKYPLQAGAARPWGAAGFTVMELLIVIFMLGIMLMISWPAVNSGMAGFRLSAAAEEVVTALEFAQLSAMTTGNKIRVAVNSSTDTIYVRRYKTPADLFGGGSELAAGAVEGETWEYMQYPLNRGTDYVIDLKTQGRFEGVDITATDFGAFTPVYFDAMGYPSRGGTTALALGDRQMVVTLDAVSGKVSVSE